MLLFFLFRVHYSCKFSLEFIILGNFFEFIYRVFRFFEPFFQWKSSCGLSKVLFTTGGLVRGIEQKRNLYIPVWSRKNITKKVQLFLQPKKLALLLVFEARSLRVTISLQFYSVLLFLFTANFTVTNSFPVTRHGFSKL